MDCVSRLRHSHPVPGAAGEREDERALCAPPEASVFCDATADRHLALHDALEAR